MKTWRILLVVGFAILALGLVSASVLALVVRPATASYWSYNGGHESGMMRGGMVGNGYAVGASGHGGCMGGRGWP